MTYGATPSGHQTHQTTHAQPKHGGRDLPGRPLTVSGGMGFTPKPKVPDQAPARTGGALKPCRGRAPELLREPSRARGEGLAHASLAASCSRPAPAPAGQGMPRPLLSQPRSQPAAAPLLRSTASSRTQRLRGGDTARKPPSEVAGRAVPAVDHGASSDWRPQRRYG